MLLRLKSLRYLGMNLKPRGRELRSKEHIFQCLYFQAI